MIVEMNNAVPVPSDEYLTLTARDGGLHYTTPNAFEASVTDVAFNQPMTQQLLLPAKGWNLMLGATGPQLVMSWSWKQPVVECRGNGVSVLLARLLEE